MGLLLDGMRVMGCRDWRTSSISTRSCGDRRRKSGWRTSRRGGSDERPSRDRRSGSVGKHRGMNVGGFRARMWDGRIASWRRGRIIRWSSRKCAGRIDSGVSGIDRSVSGSISSNRKASNELCDQWNKRVYRSVLSGLKCPRWKGGTRRTMTRWWVNRASFYMWARGLRPGWGQGSLRGTG